MILRYEIVRPDHRCPYFQINDRLDMGSPVAYFHERLPQAETEAHRLAKSLNETEVKV